MQAEDPHSELCFALWSWWDPVVTAEPQPHAEEGSNPSGLNAPSSRRFLMMPTGHVEKIRAA